jgi:ADP-ribose pyrophosphatase YjhB (NUDIX family)
MPITSIGIIVFRIVENRKIEYLMIRRKDTLGYIDFMRGKYSIYNKEYIMNMLKQMTQSEKEVLRTQDFATAWKRVWGNETISNQYRSEETISRDKFQLLQNGVSRGVRDVSDGFIEQQSGVSKHRSTSTLHSSHFMGSKDVPKSDRPILNTSHFEQPEENEVFSDFRGGKLSKNCRFPSKQYTSEIRYSLSSLIDESNQYNLWEEAEWGFPKGRRNYQEKDFECALREFSEETGYNYHHLKSIQNLMPFEEIFTGSNYKSYKHKYYLTYMDYQQSLDINTYDPTEVSKMEWKSYEDCMNSIRSYNLEKKRLITNIHSTLTLFPLILGK